MEQVKSIMTTTVVSVSADASLREVDLIFKSKQFRHLLVLSGKKVFGILSDRDLFKALSPYLGTLSEMPRDTAILNKKVHQIMTRTPVTISAEASVQEAAQQLLAKNLSCLPVVSADEEVVGILSWKDLMRALLASVSDTDN